MLGLRMRTTAGVVLLSGLFLAANLYAPAARAEPKGGGTKSIQDCRAEALQCNADCNRYSIDLPGQLEGCKNRCTNELFSCEAGAKTLSNAGKPETGGGVHPSGATHAPDRPTERPTMSQQRP